MKIISKYKDYYDYLQGIKGIDSKVVLDRTVNNPFIFNKNLQIENEHFVFVIAGKIYNVAYYDGTFIDLDKLAQEGKHYNTYTKKLENWGKSHFVSNHFSTFIEDKYYAFNTDASLSEYFASLKCPILLYRNKEWIRFPKLAEFGFARIIPAEELWDVLYNYIVSEPEIINTQTDIQKIEAHGFDKKSSFRPKIKE